MPRSILHGRRVHIAGSVNSSPDSASAEEVGLAREFVKELILALLREGCTFVVPVDANPLRAPDDLPVCFDWLIWETISENLRLRPTDAPLPLAVAVQHHKTEDQIPVEFVDLWDGLKGSTLVSIDNASHWNMASKRMEIQAARGDILITLGGCEGVLYLANLYNQAGKPVIPLDFKLSPDGKGSRRLFSRAMERTSSSDFFNTTTQTPHDWMNRLNFGTRHDSMYRVNQVVELLKSLEKPSAFAVRLLNPGHADCAEVEDFFEVVVKHVVEQELGYRLVTINRQHTNTFPRVDEEIFNHLHRSGVVIADITGARPNCFIELGYALGRSLPTIMTGREGSENPFDTNSVAGHFWNPRQSAAERRTAFSQHFRANINRPPLVIERMLTP
jgi:hypothetical protein